MKEEGYTDEILKICHIGYDERKKSIVLPYMNEEGYYITKSIEGKEYRKPKGKSEPLYQLGEKTSIVYCDRRTARRNVAVSIRSAICGGDRRRRNGKAQKHI